MSIFDQVSNDIKAAMLAKDKVKLEALRNAKKYFLEAKTAPGADDLLTDEGRESARIYTEQHRADLAEAELEQVKALEGYLPSQLSPEALEEEVKKIIAQVGATSLKEMGKVMGAASKALSGKAEGGAISEVVKRLLA